MIKEDGKFLKETIKSLGLKDDEKQKTIDNAKDIVEKIISAYEQNVGTGHVGKDGTGVPSNFPYTNKVPIGLVYGSIQSGKTRAMIASTAMAFDNGFRIAIVMTSNINDLVNQTHNDFIRDLKGVTPYTKDDALDKEIEEAKLDIQDPEGRILIVTSKGAKSLKNVTDFLSKIGAKTCPMVIFDDEGDQASLDNNTWQQSSSGDITLQPSTIHKLIVKLCKFFPASVYISVTGTPQAVLLQSASSDLKPSFIKMLPFGHGYVGGDQFFSEDDPLTNPGHLISIVPEEDKANMINPELPMPVGLKKSIIFFLLSASAAFKNMEAPENGREKDKGYQFLCHPSLKNNEQSRAESRISAFLTAIRKDLMGNTDALQITQDFEEQYNELKNQLGDLTPSLDELKGIIKTMLPRREILTINFKNPKRNGIEYGPSFNFLIGGNTLGRGIAIPNLLVTYYVRASKASQIDTMHQHARMFGYRNKTLKYTRLFITQNLYSRFRDIHYSDKGLREFIIKYESTFLTSFPVEIAPGLNPTRKSVLDINNTDTIYPGMQIYPNYIKLPQAKKTYNSIMNLVANYLNCKVEDTANMASKGKEGVTIKTENAIEILKDIKTKSKNSWNDKTITEVMNKLSQRLSTDILLKYRVAKRTINQDGFLATGTVSGEEQKQGRNNIIPTLWIMSVTGAENSPFGENETFVYPTILVPNGLPKVFVFTKK